jgi:hypothetical protein
MTEKWSHKVTRFFKQLLTVNLVSCAWISWALISSFVFITFLATKLLGTFLDKGFDGLLLLNENFKEVFESDGLFVYALLAEVLLAGILGIGWLIVKTTYFVLDKIQKVVGGNEE